MIGVNILRQKAAILLIPASGKNNRYLSFREQSINPVPCKARALVPSVRQFHHELASTVARDSPTDQLGGLPRRIVAQLSPPFFAHDPVVEGVVWST
jgi:hypothetical protein